MIRFFAIVIWIAACGSQVSKTATPADSLRVGAERLEVLLPLLKDKQVALVVNHTAMVGSTHLADTLKSLGVNLKKILAPEHGFRGTADAGETVKDGVDTKTGLPIVSLYGNNKKPTAQQVSDVDVVVFDIQDVGVRFFTYISTLHYVMEACAENNKKLLILDRPNPNARYIDGPVLEPAHKSFVGMHPIPVVHGMTIGEYARMINGEQWIAKPCELEVITMQHWQRSAFYSPPHRPSPNLATDQAIKLYPSTCLFEGTVISVGRGTQTPFQLIGHPDLKNMPYSFIPISMAGMSKTPPFENQRCFGIDLSHAAIKNQLDLSYLIELYNAFPNKENFFIPYFEKLAGTSALREQIVSGMTEAQIRETWQPGLLAFGERRKKYLLYP
jgi:uncharacterized protein YbbC (DUF1343 family)